MARTSSLNCEPAGEAMPSGNLVRVPACRQAGLRAHIIRAHSKSVLRIHGMDEGGVQFPVGPHKIHKNSNNVAQIISIKKGIDLNFGRQVPESTKLGEAKPLPKIILAKLREFCVKLSLTQNYENSSRSFISLGFGFSPFINVPTIERNFLLY